MDRGELAERRGLVQADLKAWESAGLARLAEISRLLDTADFAHKPRQRLAAVEELSLDKEKTIAEV